MHEELKGKYQYPKLQQPDHHQAQPFLVCQTRDSQSDTPSGGASHGQTDMALVEATGRINLENDLFVDATK